MADVAHDCYFFDGCLSGWWPLSEWLGLNWPDASVWSAIAALILAGIAAYQVIWNRQQAESTEKAANAARDSALSAKANADAFVQSERAHLLVSAEHPPTVTINTQATLRYITVRFEIHNYGRSPAWITGHRIRFEVVLTLPGQPPDDHIVPLEGSYAIPPGGSLSIERLIDPVGCLDQQEWNALVGGDGILVLHGLIDYRDMFGKDHRSRFAWECNINQNVFIPWPVQEYWSYT